jgi:hypothetical protein
MSDEEAMALGMHLHSILSWLCLDSVTLRAWCCTCIELVGDRGRLVIDLWFI